MISVHIRVHAVETEYSIPYFINGFKKTLHSIGLDHVNPEDIIHYIGGYNGDNNRENISAQDVFGR